MDLPTPMCRACGVDRELIEVERANGIFDLPHFRCPTCHDRLRLAVRVNHATGCSDSHSR